MEKEYKHLTKEKRNQLYLFLGEGKSKPEIAQALGVHRSAIYREIKRNEHPEVQDYLPDFAQKAASECRFRPGSKIEPSKQLK